jgi:hypothetical protein
MEFVLYSRPDCHLCDEMLDELTGLIDGHAASVRVVNVDSDPELRRRYGLRIPVLTVAGEEVCATRLAPGRVRSLLTASD